MWSGPSRAVAVRMAAVTARAFSSPRSRSLSSCPHHPNPTRKASEGIDFADAHARAVVLLGIPYPAFKDTKVGGWDVGVWAGGRGPRAAGCGGGAHAPLFLGIRWGCGGPQGPGAPAWPSCPSTPPQVALKKDYNNARCQREAAAARGRGGQAAAAAAAAAGHRVGGWGAAAGRGRGAPGSAPGLLTSAPSPGPLLSGDDWYSQQAFRALNQVRMDARADASSCPVRRWSRGPVTPSLTRHVHPVLLSRLSPSSPLLASHPSVPSPPSPPALVRPWAAASATGPTGAPSCCWMSASARHGGGRSCRVGCAAPCRWAGGVSFFMSEACPGERSYVGLL